MKDYLTRLILTFPLLAIAVAVTLANTNDPPMPKEPPRQSQIATNQPAESPEINAPAHDPMQLRSVQAVKDAQRQHPRVKAAPEIGTNAPAADTNAPVAAPAPVAPPRQPVYVIPHYSVYRTPAGPILEADAFHVKALSKMFPVTHLVALWTPDGPVLCLDPDQSETVTQFQVIKGTNLVFYAR